MLMTDPPPALISSGMPCLHDTNGPNRSSRITRQNSSSGTSVTIPSWAEDPPATLHSTLSRPNSATARAIASRTWPLSPASICSAIACPASASATAARAAPTSMSVAATRAPSSRKRRQIALPIPPPAPVTNATLPLSLNIALLLACCSDGECGRRRRPSAARPSQDVAQQPLDAQFAVTGLASEAQERLDAVARLVGGHKLPEAEVLLAQAILNRAAGEIDDLLREPHGVRRAAGNPRCGGGDELLDLRWRQRSVEVPPPLRRDRVEVESAEDELQGARPSYQSWQVLRRATARNRAERDRHGVEDGLPDGAEAHVARHDQGRAAAGRAALDLRDGDLAHRAQPLADLMHPVERDALRRSGNLRRLHGVEVCELVVRDEDVRIVALDDDDHRLRVGSYFRGEPVQLLDQFTGQHVQRRVVDDGGHDPIAARQRDARVSRVRHACSPRHRAGCPTMCPTVDYQMIDSILDYCLVIHA